MKRVRVALNPVVISALVVILFPAMAYSAVFGSKPAGDAAADHTFPALGASVEPKVRAEWNRYHDHAGLALILTQLNKAFPDLTKLYSVGKSVEGRDLWCLEVTARKVGNPDRKPGMWIDGNIHGNEVQAGEVVAYTAWYLCHQYGRLKKVTDLLDNRVFYLVPTINPDGRDRFFHTQNPSTRSGSKPYDNDRDGLFDEDDAEDINGDGFITQMRIKDPNGRFKPHPDYPKTLLVRVKDDEKGQYTPLGSEGIDNDGDGRINEDGIGGYDGNRDWPRDWQPGYVQSGALEYPASLPETRGIVDFVLAHPNIAAFQSYHNSGGMILRSPGRLGGVMLPQDERVLTFIGSQGEKMLPFYRSIIIFKDLYTVWGGEIDWFYAGRGILSFSNELWTPKNLYRSAATPPTDTDDAFFLENVLLNDGVVEWKEFDHPTYGKIEIGGTKKEWGRMPPSFLLEEECHRNMAFTLYHADQTPLLKIADVKADKMADGLYKVWVTIENSKLIPTRTAVDVANNISPPDVVTLAGPKVKVLSAGRVTDRYFKKVEAVKRRPERVELSTIGGMGAERVQFVVSGRGAYTVTVDSAKGGLLVSKQTLP
jgi:hypothetical protein